MTRQHIVFLTGAGINKKKDQWRNRNPKQSGVTTPLMLIAGDSEPFFPRSPR